MASTNGTLSYHAASGYWHVTPLPHVAYKLKRLFPKILTAKTGTLQIKSTADVARDLEWFMTRYPFDMGPADLDRLTVLANGQRQMEEQIDWVMSGKRLDVTADRTPLRPPKYDHQKSNADLITLTQRILIGDTLGAGKTYSATTTFRNAGSLPAVVVVPTHLTDQWVDEIALDYPDLRCHIVKTGQVYTPKVSGAEPDVLIITYSKLAKWSSHLREWANTVIFDEVHDLRRGSESDKGRAAATIAFAANYVVGLSSTPVWNKGDEMWNILDIVKPDVLGTKGEFLREWCDDDSKVRDPRALGLYLRSIGVLVGVDMEEQKPVRVPHEINVTDTQVFDQMTGDAAEMAKFILSGEGSSTDRWRTSGDLERESRQATGIAKAPHVAAFVRFLLDTTDKVLLLGWHRSVYGIWLDLLADMNPVLYTGTETPKQKLASKHAFVKGDSRVMIMSIRSGSGLNGLQHVCNTAVVGEFDWSPGPINQCIGRLNRPGQPNLPVHAYMPWCDAGTDPTMIETLGWKRQQADPMMNPDVERIIPVYSPDRVKQLARDLLERSGQEIPQPQPKPQAPPAPAADETTPGRHLRLVRPDDPPAPETLF